MQPHNFTITCDLCGKQCRYGQGVYEAHKLHLYGGIMCCNSCWESNWDGWSAQHEPKILHHLQSKNLPVPQRNSKGRLPRN